MQITFDPTNAADLAVVRLLTGAAQAAGPATPTQAPPAPALATPAAAPGLAPAVQAPAAETVPRAVMQTAGPYRSVPGSLRWQAAGTTYAIVAATNGEAAWVALYSSPGTPADGVVTLGTVETILDGGLDIKTPANTDDAARAYVVALLPKIDAAIKTIADRMGGLHLFPVSSDPIPASVSALDRVAGLLPQMVQITATGATLK